jgi:hypothetical protein
MVFHRSWGDMQFLGDLFLTEMFISMEQEDKAAITIFL